MLLAMFSYVSQWKSSLITEVNFELWCDMKCVFDFVPELLINFQRIIAAPTGVHLWNDKVSLSPTGLFFYYVIHMSLSWPVSTRRLWSWSHRSLDIWPSSSSSMVCICFVSDLLLTCTSSLNVTPDHTDYGEIFQPFFIISHLGFHFFPHTAEQNK